MFERNLHLLRRSCYAMNLFGVSRKPGMKAKFNIYTIFSLSGTEVSLKHIYVLLAS